MKICAPKNIDNFIHKSQKLEIAQVSIHQRIDKRTVIYSYSRLLLLSKTMEWITDIFNNLEISLKIYAERSLMRKNATVWFHFYEVLE